MKFVDATHMISSTCISRDDLRIAGELLESFVVEYQEMYGTQHMTFNIHQLRHYISCTIANGPPVLYSNYHMESNIGHLLGFVKGTNDVAEQVSTKYLLEKSLLAHVKKYPTTTEYYEEIQADSNYFTAIDKLFTLRKLMKNSRINNELMDMLKNLTDYSDDCVVNEYRQIFIMGNFFEVIPDEGQLKKRTYDSFVVCNDGTMGELIHIFSLAQEVYLIIRTNYEENNDLYQNECNYIHFLRHRIGTIKIVNIKDVLRKAVFVKCADIVAYSFLPNNLLNN